VSTPEALFRNAIDLNRYSNSVARRLINAYNDIILDAVDQLRAIDELAAPVKAARLRAIIAQLRDSLSSWAGDATELTAIELQGLAELQSEFVTQQLRQVLPAGVRDAVRTVEISPQFAQSVVTTDPTQINVVALSDDLYKSVYGAEALAQQAGTGVFNLTAARGTAITLPNGEVVRKAFRGIAVDQGERFSQVVRNGLLTGEPTPAIAKRLKGTLERSEDRLRFGEPATTAGQRRAAGISDTVARGGQATRMADNQILTVVRTSVNQVANAASQQVYEANQDITKKYRYVATLDSRTSAICRANDGKVYDYGKGPQPPLHFNCLPGDALVTPSGRIAAVYRRRYKGLLYVIETADGHVLRVTPNHPVLTLSGWQPAQSINVGDQVFRRSIIPRESASGNDEGNAVATAEDVFRAFRKSVTVSAVEVPTTAPDFHGDAWSGAPGVNLAKQVAVVLADRELLLTVNPSLLQLLLDNGFQGANPAPSGRSHFDLSGFSVGSSALGGMSSGSQGLALSRRSSTHPRELLLTPVARPAAGFSDDPLYGTWRDVELISDSSNTDAAVVKGNDAINVVRVRREPFSGHVYNFETEGGTYWADSILTHNCRSTTVPVIDYKQLSKDFGFEVTPPPPGRRAAAGGPVPADMTYGEWLAKQDTATQAKALGDSKVPYFNMLAKKHGPQAAIAKLVRDDGRELTLTELRKRYGTAEP
jgi:SPP1 gp7 family putative phage head morphogenesis protein